MYMEQSNIMNNRHDENLLVLTYIGWIVFNILYLLGIVATMFAAWELCVALYGSGWWSMLPLAAAIMIGGAVNLLFVREIRRI